ncbi:MAG: DUF5717 family protein [Defluviitaleaceae bacterium]|nr:DUF5717 family protein [Defluviitaleaceae bacterium]
MISQIFNTDEKRGRAGSSATIILALRCWQAFRFLEPDYEMRVHLQRANHAAIAAHRKNLVHMKLYTLAVFIAIEAGHYDSANEMLDKAMNYKSFLRANEPFYYGCLCFLYAYLELNQRRIRSAKKHRRALDDHIKNTQPTGKTAQHFTVMQGLLHLAANEITEAYNKLTEAYREGCNSVFMYEGLFRYYKNFTRGPEGTSVLPVLTYAAARGADIVSIASKFPETLSAAIKADPAAGEKLYAVSNFSPILKDICTYRIKKGDMSAEAFFYYQEAEKKQIYAPSLFGAIIHASFENNAPKINRYPLAKFLAAAKEKTFDKNIHFAVYVYHFLLTDPSLADLLPEAQNKIIQLGARCLEAGIKSREANSIYYYFWSRCRALGISGVDLEKTEEVLSENLTKFELRLPENSAVKYIYITEPEKRGMSVYEIPANENENPTTALIEIEATSENPGCTCLGPGRRTIPDEKLTILPMVGLAGVELYLYFFQKGDRRFHLLTYLTNHYLAIESPPDDAAPVFEAMLATKGTTKAYRMRILVALGRLHYNAFSFEQALECYAEVDDDALGNDFIDQILNVYLQTREYERAAAVLSKKSHSIPPQKLFDAVTTLLKKAKKSEKINPAIYAIGYNLLLNGFFSDDLLNNVLENFSASYGEWAELARVLEEENRSLPKLDEHVLKTALYMSRFDAPAQKAFSRLRSASKDSPLLAEFIELATYHMLAKSTRPSYDTLTILENSDNDSILLSWALAGIYLKHNITTFKSEEIIKNAMSASESEGILFPVFKENAPANSPFIEKYQPFLYQSLPNKDCWLYYRMEDSSAVQSIPMQYIRYGLYVAAIPLFYNESLTYYFSEEMPSGSITTKETSIKNTKPFIHEDPTDPYFAINNAIICEQMFKHDKVETLISGLVKDVAPVRARLL